MNKNAYIPAAYYSRISNAQVLQQSGSRLLTAMLLERRLDLFGKIALQTDRSLERHMAFIAGTLEPASWHGRRGRGRPRQNWGDSVYKHAVLAAGGAAQLEGALQKTGDSKTDYARWRRVVRAHVRPEL